MEKRLILAITLSVLVVLIFQSLFRPPVKTKPHGPQTTNAIVSKPGEIEGIGTAKTGIDTATKKDLNEVETVYETDKFILTFTNLGGALKNIKLKEYDTLLVKEQDSTANLFSLTSPQLDPNLSMAEYELIKEENRLIYKYQTPKNIIIRKEFIFHKTNDYIELQLFIENKGDSPISADYTIIGPSNIEEATSMKNRHFIEMNAQIDGVLVRKSRIRGQQEIIKGVASWLGLKNRYFTIAMKPPDITDGVLLQQDKNNNLITGIIVKPRVFNQKSTVQDSYIVYAGPLAKKRLAALNIGLDGMMSYGFFGGISIFLLSILGGLHAAVHNWGISIILVTMLINIVLFPLTKKSFHSMQKMQELQPHMEKLRQLHKDNPQKLNKEIMELYRQYNVNPFGGCLPMLLQLPIFVAFYQALMRSIELKNAKFLWIKDLSGPDVLFAFHRNIPILGENFSLLPILTIIAMFVQQHISTKQSTKNISPELARQQKFMTLFFPVFFGFILYNLPSGLVLYWLTNSILMTAEQMLLKRHKT